MANIPSVAKRARQSVKRRARNSEVISSIKTAKKKARVAAGVGDRDAALAAYSELASKLDKAAKRGIIHANAANRGKSRARKAIGAA
jgi:small subunit ribosomal protein S20